tara:strand:- start:2669 stop:3682 length:1014 start_codon:yes stop_codon:yes gene_type:complete
MQNNRNLENDLHRILSNYLSETAETANIYNNNNTYTRTNIPRTRARNNFNTPFVQRNTSVILQTLLDNLQNNMSDYHENVSSYLNILNTIISNDALLFSQNSNEPHNLFSRQTPAPNLLPRQNQSGIFSRNPPSAQHETATNTPPNNQFENLFAYGISLIPNNLSFQNVVVRATQEQINNATETLEYTSSLDLINNSCPISLERFDEGEEIIKIIHCGHCFQSSSFNNWFSNNTRCPVCRYDIREYDTNSNTDASNNSEPMHNNETPYSPIHHNGNLPTFDDNSINNILSDSDFNTVSNNISNNMTTYFDSSNNLALRLEIPLTFTRSFDNSNNLYN